MRQCTFMYWWTQDWTIRDKNRMNGKGTTGYYRLISARLSSTHRNLTPGTGLIEIGRTRSIFTLTKTYAQRDIPFGLFNFNKLYDYLQKFL